MPDYFVPIDTSYFTDYYRDIISKGIFNQFILNYEDRNRSALSSKYSQFRKFLDEFNVSEEMHQQLIQYAEKEGLKFNKEEYEKSREVLDLLIKSYIARDLWTTSEFYRIFNQKDPIYQKAIEVIEHPDLYARKLQAYTGE
jgi:carboxyl-terminal processing protease